MKLFVRWCALLGCGLWANALSASGAELGLDLSSETDFRPSAAFAGIMADDTLSPRAWTTWRLDRLQLAAENALIDSAHFSKLFNRSEVFDRLSDQYGALFLCRDVSCFQTTSEQLNVQVLLWAKFKEKDARTFLEVGRYAQQDQSLEIVVVQATGNPKQFQAAVLEAVVQAAQKSAAPLSLLKVRSQTPAAQVFDGDKLLGNCPLEKLMAPGEHSLSVRAPGYLTDEFEVRLKAEDVLELEANLVPRLQSEPQAEDVVGEWATPAVETKLPPSKPNLWSRPGLYVAGAGLVAVAVGTGFGLSAHAAQRQMIDADNDGTLDLTRRRALAARLDATWANALWAVGGAATLGGLTWLLWPQGASASALITPQGMTLGLSGEWP